MTAEEVRQKAVDIQYDNIMKNISFVIDHYLADDYFTYKGDDILPEVRERLTEEGYTVGIQKYTWYGGDPRCKISWKE